MRTVPAKVRSVHTGQESRLGADRVKAMHLRRATTIIDRGWCGSPILGRPTYIAATAAAAPPMQQAQLAATWRSDDVERFLTEGRDWKVMRMALAMHMHQQVLCQPPPAKSFKAKPLSTQAVVSTNTVLNLGLNCRLWRASTGCWCQATPT